MPPRPMLRPCLGCGRLVRGRSRCPACQRAFDRPRNAAKAARRRQRYGPAWRKLSREMREAHVATYGYWCFGWGVPPHPSTDLVLDHGPPLRCMCRSCNSRAAAVRDRDGKGPGPAVT